MSEPRAKRWEPWAYAAAVLLHTWLLLPREGSPWRALSAALLVVWPLAALRARRVPLRELGLRADTLGPALVEAGLFTLLALLVLLALGLAAGHPPALDLRAARRLPPYLGWALAQQLVLQGYVLRGLRAGGLGPGGAALASGALFGLCHLPNPALSAATCVAGVAWGRIFQRHPSLWALAGSHALLAVFLRAALPPSWLHGLRTGPRYWEWTP